MPSRVGLRTWVLEYTSTLSQQGPGMGAEPTADGDTAQMLGYCLPPKWCCQGKLHTLQN